MTAKAAFCFSAFHCFNLVTLHCDTVKSRGQYAHYVTSPWWWRSTKEICTVSSDWSVAPAVELGSVTVEDGLKEYYSLPTWCHRTVEAT